MPRMRNEDLVFQLANLVREHPDFEALHKPTLNSYCFRCVPNDLVDRQEEPEVQALLDASTKRSYRPCSTTASPR